MVNEIFKVIEIGLISLWSLAFSLSCLGVADKEAASRIMAMSFGLSLAAALAWWVVA